ncbi:SLC13 family permease [Neorickettsia helminthoeca]|nr:SLC13 family permease [Neorickettsia helminthoeca]
MLLSTYCLITEKFRAEAVAFTSIGLLAFYQGIAFSKPLVLLEGMMNGTVITILGITVMGRMVACTGAINKFASLTMKTDYVALIPMILILVSYFSSAFINNTPVVVLLITFLSICSRKIGIANSSVMMPIAFAASLGGMLTVLGSSTNLLIYSKAGELGVDIGFFGFFTPALFIGLFGLAYVVALTIILPVRGGQLEYFRSFFFALNPIEETRSIFSSVSLREIKSILYNRKFSKNLLIDEIVITEKSELIGLDILSQRVINYFQALGIGISGASRKIVPGVRLVIVHEGHTPTLEDVIVKKNNAYILSHHNGLRVVFTFIAVIFLSAVFKLPLAFGVSAGLTLLVLSGTVDVAEIFGSIEVKLFLMLIYSLVLGKSLEMTGVLEVFTQLLYEWTYDSPLIALIAVTFLIVSLLNEIMSNNAVGLIFTPVVFKLSNMMDIDPKYLVWTLVFAANSAFSTPFGYQANLIVMESGKYKYSDYLKFGTPLNFIVLGAYLLYLYLFSNLDLFHSSSGA